MNIKEIKVTPYMKIGFCEKCGGELVPTGTVFCTYPAIYEYKCSKCGNIEESKEKLNQIFYKNEEIPVP